MDITKRSSDGGPSPSSLGDSKKPGSDFTYVLKEYPTIDIMHGKGPSRAGGYMGSIPILTEEDRKTGKIG